MLKYFDFDEGKVKNHQNVLQKINKHYLYIGLYIRCICGQMCGWFTMTETSICSVRSHTASAKVIIHHVISARMSMNCMMRSMTQYSSHPILKISPKQNFKQELFIFCLYPKGIT
jgi:hypothetical protein